MPAPSRIWETLYRGGTLPKPRDRSRPAALRKPRLRAGRRPRGLDPGGRRPRAGPRGLG